VTEPVGTLRRLYKLKRSNVISGRYEEYDSCGKKQESPVQIYRRHPTELACLQELLKRLQDRHVQCVQAVVKAEKAASDAPNVMQSMILFRESKNRAKASQDRAKASQDKAKVDNKDFAVVIKR
jgi:hypothetical protein